MSAKHSVKTGPTRTTSGPKPPNPTGNVPGPVLAPGGQPPSHGQPAVTINADELAYALTHLSPDERKQFFDFNRDRSKRGEILVSLDAWRRMRGSGAGFGWLPVVNDADATAVNSMDPNERKLFLAFNSSRAQGHQNLLTIDEWHKAGSPGGAPTPGDTYTPGTPGVPTPPVDPFLTPDQIITQAQARGAFETGTQDVDNQLKNMSTDNDYQKGQLDKGAVQASAAENENAISRGLFQSSIRDAELFDIEATKSLRKQHLDDALNLAVSQGETRKKTLKDTWDAVSGALNTQAVLNAQDKGKDANPWQTAPTAGTWTPPATPAPPTPGAPKPPKSQQQIAQEAANRIRKGTKKPIKVVPGRPRGY